MPGGGVGACEPLGVDVAAAALTMIVPFIRLGWISQWYWYVPGVSKRLP